MVLETATLQSEISMSLAPTDDTRTLVQVVRRRAGSAAADFAASASTSVDTEATTVPGSPACCPKFCLRRRRWAINVEPVIVLMSAYAAVTNVGSMFLLWARCIEIFNHQGDPSPDFIPENVTALCLHLGEPNNTWASDRVEADVAKWTGYMAIGNTIPTIIVSTIMGTWADGSGGRRLPMMIGMFASVCFVSLQILGMLTYKQWNVYYLWMASSVINGLLGSGSTAFACAYAIVTDDSRHQLKEGRSSVPIRVGIASAGQMIGIFLGSLMLKLVVGQPMATMQEREWAYLQANCIGLGLVLVAILYALLFVRETNVSPSQPRAYTYSVSGIPTTDGLHAPLTVPMATTTVGYTKRLRAFMYDLTAVLVEPRPGWTRFCLNLSLLAIFAEFVGSDNTVLFLLVKHSPLDWSDETYATYAMMKTFLMSLGMILLPLTFGKIKCILGKDSFLIIMAAAAGGTAAMIPAFSQTWAVIFYGTSALCFFTGGMAPGYRSFLPRMVRKEQTARLFTAFTIVGNLCPVVSTVLFTSIYRATLHWWAGFALLVGGACQYAVFLTQIIIHLLMRPQWIEQRELRNRQHDRGDRLQNDSSEEMNSGIPTPNRGRSRSFSTTAVYSSEDGYEDDADDTRPLLC